MTVLPYPLLAASLLLMWMTLNSFSIGHFILGAIIATVASWAMAALRPAKPRLRKWYLLPKLLGMVLYDIVRSNIAVVGIILTGRARTRRSGFMTIHIELKDTTALALLAVILTSTPGTAWLEYNSSDGTLLMHILDLVEEQEWTDLVKNRYERLLMEIFE